MKPQPWIAALSTACLILVVLLALPGRSQSVDADLQRAVDARDWRTAIAIIDRAIATNPKHPKIGELRAYRQRLAALLKAEPNPPVGVAIRLTPGTPVPTVTVPVARIGRYDEETWCQSAQARSAQQPFGITQARIYVDPQARVIKEKLLGCLTNNSSSADYMLTIACSTPGQFMIGTFSGPAPGKTEFFDIPFTTQIDQVDGCDLSVSLNYTQEGIRVQKWVFQARQN